MSPKSEVAFCKKGNKKDHWDPRVAALPSDPNGPLTHTDCHPRHIFLGFPPVSASLRHISINKCTYKTKNKSQNFFTFCAKWQLLESKTHSEFHGLLLSPDGCGYSVAYLVRPW